MFFPSTKILDNSSTPGVLINPATKESQTDGSQKAQIVDASGNVLTSFKSADSVGANDRGLILLLQDYTSGTALYKPASGDKFNGALNTIDIAHWKTHAGKKFHVNEYQSVTNGTNYDYLMVTAASNFPHFVFAFECPTQDVIVSVYTGTTVSANGTAQTSFNMNRASATTAAMLVYKTPTITGN